MNFEEREYLSNPRKDSFTATVTGAEMLDNGNYAVYLEATLFYPVSGGQPDDRGTIGERNVLEVKETGQGVCHTVDGKLEVGKEYYARIDFKRRLDFMQQHSGQHLLSRVFLKKLGASTVSFHLGELCSTVDLDISPPPDEQLRGVEEEANRWVLKDAAIRTCILSREEYGKKTERKDENIRAGLPEGVEKVRLVEIEGLDTTACCGTHCSSTGEIGMIKILGMEKYGDNTRITFVCGMRAWQDYYSKHTMLKELALRFSTEWSEVDRVVDKMRDENRELKKIQKALLDELAGYRSDKLEEEAEGVGNYKLISKAYEYSPADALRNMASRIKQKEGFIVLLSSRAPRPALVFARSGDVPLNMGELLKNCAGAMGARGGGGDDFAQGGGGDPDMIDQVLHSAENNIKEGIQ